MILGDSLHLAKATSCRNFLAHDQRLAGDAFRQFAAVARMSTRLLLVRRRRTLDVSAFNELKG